MVIGRFAPSPTGPMHFGSLIAAVASYCEAKTNGGKWLVRMEDVDKIREMPGAANDILRTLEGFGFQWDGEVVIQSHRSNAYQAAFEKLKQQKLVYPCICSRKEIADSSTQTGIEGKIYPRTCYHHPPALQANSHAAYRLITNESEIRFIDAIQGEICQTLNRDIGDFVLKRADGLFAYQLAVAVDDAEQGVTHVVRGADLIDSTPRQIYLQRLLAYSTPKYAHVPVAVNANGEKLSKQTLAEPISSQLANQQLFAALAFLGQQPPEEIKSPSLSTTSLEEIWAWAFQHWALAKVARQRSLPMV